ncbi:MAG: hypothetical protein QOK21_3342 [Solirubrobacteraceae bacterium]|jgi:hypothetical protein|nr:hypothetical protein [Solirubrobacteraceae bacterium]
MAAEPIARAVEVVVGDEPGRWAALGFTVDAGAIAVGGVRIVPAGGPPGLRELRLSGLRAERPDGLALTSAPQAESAAAAHPIGAAAVDHIVALTDDAARTSAALEAAGLPLRRVRRPPESDAVQAFHLAGTLIVEVVETAGPAPRLWGLVLVVADLDAAAALLGDRLAASKDAVQRGRRIATVRRTAGLSLPLALMTPRS